MIPRIASVESLDIANVNTYLAHLQQSPLDEENVHTPTRELVNMSILSELDNRHYPTLADGRWRWRNMM